MRVSMNGSRWALVASAVVLAAGCSAPPPPPGEHAHTVHVSAEASVNIAPDIATLHASLAERTPPQPADTQSSTNAAVLGQSRQQLEDRVGDVIRTIEKEGIAKKDISAGSLNIRPEYFTQDSSADHKGQRMVRTLVQRPVTITIRDLDKVPQVIDALTSAGVDNLSGVDYSLADPDKASDEALKKALERAKAKATLMVDSLGAKLGKVNSIEEQGNSPIRPQMRMMVQSAAAAPGAKAAPEYRQGQISRKASVDVTWSIE